VLYALDIETTGLSPLQSKMVSVAVASRDESFVIISEDEHRLFTDLTNWLCSPHREKGTIVTWNGGGFDWPYMLTRAELIRAEDFLSNLTMVPSDDRPPVYKPTEGHAGGYIVKFGGHDHVDIMRPWKPWSVEKGIRNGLKDVSKAHGIEVIEVDRTKISSLTRAELVAYNISDVAATYELAEKLGDTLETWRDSKLF
jgi:uncharacterized protein YprB with RNaseH-like and TPR domain